MDFCKKLVGVSLLIASCVHAGDLDDNLIEDVPTVLTPTKLRQSLRDVPGSVTVITQEELVRLGIRSVAEALRLVPGMMMSQAYGHDYRINYHGTNSLVPRRMQVLIDGVSVLRNGMARVDWAQLPVPIENVARIEVTRSPSSSTYGSNSFQAIVNIITRLPSDRIGTEASVYGGAKGRREAYVSHGASLGNTDIALSYKRLEDGGFDRSVDEDPNREYTSKGRDDSSFNIINLNTTTYLSPTSELRIQAGLVDGDLEWEAASGDQTSFPDSEVSDQLLGVTYINDLSDQHELQISWNMFRGEVKQDWGTCQPYITMTREAREMYLANPAYAAALLRGEMPSGGTARDDQLALAVLQKVQQLGAAAMQPVCGKINHDLEDLKTTLEVQDTYVYSDQLRFVSGLGYSYYYTESQTFLNGKVDHERFYLFTNLEYKPSVHWTFNAGAMLERESALGSDIEISPRAAIAYHINDYHTVKAVYSVGKRTPDIMESDRDWNYYSRDMTPLVDGSSRGVFYMNAQATRKLKSEEIRSHELIFMGTTESRKLNYDLKFFYEELDRLISEKAAFFAYDPSNDNEVTLHGGEVQASYSLTHDFLLSGGYAYVDSKASHSFEQTLHANHSGFLTAQWQLPWFTTGVGYYGNNGVGGNSYDRVDLTLFDQVQWNRLASLEWSLTVRHYLSDAVSVIEDAGQRIINSYNDDTHVYAGLGVRF